MKNWNKIGFIALGSAAVLVFAGAGGRSAVWATPEAEVHIQAPQSSEVAVSDGRVADAFSDNGPGCAESSLSR